MRYISSGEGCWLGWEYTIQVHVTLIEICFLFNFILLRYKNIYCELFASNVFNNFKQLFDKLLEIIN